MKSSTPDVRMLPLPCFAPPQASEISSPRTRGGTGLGVSEDDVSAAMVPCPRSL